MAQLSITEKWDVWWDNVLGPDFDRAIKVNKLENNCLHIIIWVWGKNKKASRKQSKRNTHIDIMLLIDHIILNIVANHMVDKYVKEKGI